MVAPSPMPRNPPAITAIQPSPRQPRRVMVSVEHKPVATLSRKLAEQLQLTVGVVWSEALAQQVRQAAAYDQALSRATRMLARRPLSRARLRARLAPQIPSPELLEKVMARLEVLGLLDDAALGRQYLEELRRKHPAGPTMWREKLLAQGLDEGLVEQLLDETARQTDPLALANQLVETKIHAWRGLPPIQQRRRLYGLLARRGFDEDIVMQVVERWVPEDA